MQIITPSKWLYTCAFNSQLIKCKPIQVIPYSVLEDIFHIYDTRFCREVMGLPMDKVVVLTGSLDFAGRRKGKEYFIEALKILCHQNIVNNVVIAVLGEKSEMILDEEINIYYLGKINDERLLSICYNAADLFALPSIEENYSNMVLESMACGIPVIGFDVGGNPEMIQNYETGLLAELQNSEDLSNKILWMITHPGERKQMGLKARKIAEKSYTTKKQIDKYVELYKKQISL